MEQLNIVSTKDNDKVYKILGDLMKADKEFQIMITVPSTKGGQNAAEGRTVPRDMPSGRAPRPGCRQARARGFPRKSGEGGRPGPPRSRGRRSGRAWGSMIWRRM